MLGTVGTIRGTKSTRGDLAILPAQGRDVDIAADVRRGGPVLGPFCGYQIRGPRVADPEGIEGADTCLGRLDVKPLKFPDKRSTEVAATLSFRIAELARASSGRSKSSIACPE